MLLATRKKKKLCILSENKESIVTTVINKFRTVVQRSRGAHQQQVVGRGALAAAAVLLVFFAFNEIYLIPVIRLLDLSLSIGNAEIARFLDLSPSVTRIDASDLFRVRGFDLLIWLAQTAIGY